MKKAYIKDPVYSVYVHVLLAEISKLDYDKYYVGLTSVDPKQRWGRGSGYQMQPFYQVILQYGWDNIEHIIVAQNIYEYEAIVLEQHLIAVLHTTDPDYGFNKTKGGEVTGRLSPETKKKLSELAIQRGNPFANLSPESKRKQRENRTYKKGGDSHSAKTIYQFDDKGTFLNKYPSISEAAEATGYCIATISGIANHYKCSRYKTIFEFEENVTKTENGYQIINNVYHSYHNKKILIYDKEMNYITTASSVEEAGKILQVNKKLIPIYRDKGLRIKRKYYVFYEEDKNKIQSMIEKLSIKH